MYFSRYNLSYFNYYLKTNLHSTLAFSFTFTDCAELYKKGFKEDGVYTISPDGFRSFQVGSVNDLG